MDIKPTMEDSFAVVRHKQEIDAATDIQELKAVAKKVVDWAYSLKTYNQHLMLQQLLTTFAPPQAQTDPETAATRAGLFAQAAEQDHDYTLETHNHPL